MSGVPNRRAQRMTVAVSVVDLIGITGEVPLIRLFVPREFCQEITQALLEKGRGRNPLKPREPCDLESEYRVLIPIVSLVFSNDLDRLAVRDNYRQIHREIGGVL